MRVGFSVTLTLMVVAMIVCIVFAVKSHKPIGKYTAILVASLIPPVVGNLFIIASPYEILSTVGCYIYFIGMDLAMYGLIRFTYHYCNLSWPKFIKYILFAVLALDIIQLIIDVFTHHAFTMETIQAYGGDYYRYVAKLGLMFHRAIDYFILLGILVVFIVKSIREPRAYKERYIVILLAMLLVAAWQSFYIISRTPVDFSMVGFGVFAILVFLLSIYYKPIVLLDRMLAEIASKMPEAILFFETNGRCIWANQKGLELFGITSEELDNIPSLLKERFSEVRKEGDEWQTQYVGKKEDGSLLSYAIEKRVIKDSRERIVGIYISFRDNSNEQLALKQKTYEATHDLLTNVYNRAGYEETIKEIDVHTAFFILLDIDCFKETNDEYGHIIGDKVLVKVINTVKKHFRNTEYIYRIGGDEFAIIIPHANKETASTVKERIDLINKELAVKENNLPVTSISAGGAYGSESTDALKLFSRADRALYISKSNGKSSFTLIE